jgi:hypothetical protein
MSEVMLDQFLPVDAEVSGGPVVARGRETVVGAE